MRISRHTLLLACAFCASSQAASNVVQASAAYSATLSDGGIYFGVMPLPGQDVAVIGFDNGGFNQVTALSLMKLAGADAGLIVGSITSSSKMTMFFDAVRVERNGATQLWLQDVFGNLWRLDGTQATPLVLNSLDGYQFTYVIPALASNGHLRLDGEDSAGRFSSAKVYALRDGTVGIAVTSTLPSSFNVDTLLPAPMTDTVYGGGAYGAYRGSFASPDAGWVGIDGGWIQGSFLATVSFVYVLQFNVQAGSFEVSELTPGAIVSRGSFQLQVDGGGCGFGCSASGIIPIPEAFPGFPSGGVLIRSYRLSSTGPEQIVVINWGDVASALSLQTDSKALPAALLEPDPGDGGTGGGGGGGGGGAAIPVAPGPWVPVPRSSGGCSATPLASPAPLLVALLAGLLLGLRARKRR